MATNWILGALGGGGFAQEITMSPDGDFFLIRSNLANSPRWKRSTNHFDNLSVSPNMDALGMSLNMVGTPYGHGIGPNGRCYLVCSLLPPRWGYGFKGADVGQLYRSDDGGDTWFKPGSANPATDNFTYPISCWTGDQYNGPPIAVDPVNEDVVYIQGVNGAVLVSYDGGVTIAPLLDLMDLAMHKAIATGNTSPYGNSDQPYFKVDSNPILAASGTWGVFNATAPFSVGGSFSDIYSAGTSTSTIITVPHVQSRDGEFYGFGSNLPGVSDGDEIYFGFMGGIAIDPSEGTVVNTGGTGVRSKLVYFSFQRGATADAVWCTADGGSTFAAVGSGGPSFTYGKLKLSNDAVLGGGGNNVLYTGDGSNFWRWVRTKPTGAVSSGLTNNTWTSWTAAAIYPIGAQSAQIMLPDPAVQGRVVFMRQQYTPVVSLTHGNTNLSYTDGVENIGTGDTNWMNDTNDVVLGDAAFDLVTAGRIWIASGVGTYYSDVPNSSALTTVIPWMQTGLQSLISSYLVKIPSPNSKIAIGLSQDRAIIIADDEFTVPSGYFPGTGVDQSAGTICYSISDPTQIFCGYAGNLYKYDGTTTGATQNWTKITGFLHTFTVGVIKSFFGLVGGSGYTPAVGTVTYNAVALTGGSGSGATANITVTNGAVTAVALVSGGADTYVLAASVSAAAANIGGTGSGFSIQIAEVNVFSTTNTSATVTVTYPSHGFTAGVDRVYLYNFSDFNNVTLVNKNFSVVSTPDSGHFTITSSTTANATSFGGAGAICDIHGWPANVGWPSVMSSVSTKLFAVCASSPNVQHGKLIGGNWIWQDTLFGGSPLVAVGTNVFGKAKIVVPSPTDGTIWYFDAIAHTLYKSTDGGETLTRPGGGGDMTTYVGGDGMMLAVVPGVANNLFWADGRAGDGSAIFNPANNRLLKFTNDGGDNWTQITATNYIYSVACGPAKPGTSYPAIYIIGQMLADDNFDFRIWRCTDFNPSSPNSCTWEDIGEGLKDINCELLVGGIYADPEVYGKIYVLSADTGYMVGSEDEEPPVEGVTATRAMTNTYGKMTFKRVKIPQA